jgi:hypothetical protein
MLWGVRGRVTAPGPVFWAMLSAPCAVSGDALVLLPA